MTSAILRGLTLAGAAAMLLAGCGQPPDQFIIIQNQVPEAGCVIPTTLGSVYRSTGVIDVAVVPTGATIGYEIFPLLQNNLPPPSGGQQGDPNRIALSGYDVDVSPMDDAPAAILDLFSTLQTSGTDGMPDQLIKYSEPTSGSVASGGGNTSSGVNGLPGALARKIHDAGVFQAGAAPFHVEATIRAVGRTTIKQYTSDAFHFPILVCSGCLIANAVDGRVPACPTSSAANQGNECNVAQDQVVDCCTTNSGELLCPPTVTSR
ncbi:MAG TPA: hypothetical protein VHJ20_17125 [Polyangia bacterium]|nr:hypothetical protein [Polyangia bacterium]